MIFECQKCNQLNRVPDRPRTDGRYRCGVCGHIVLHRRVTFHSSLLLDVRESLEDISMEVAKIPTIHLRFGTLDGLKERLSTAQARMEQWLDHAEYAGASDSRQSILIIESYRPDINQIKELTERVEIEIKARKWPELIRAKHPVIYFTAVAFSRYFGTLADVLSVFGLNDYVSGFLRQLIPLNLESKSTQKSH